jgi:single-strand DNA-binding protein
MGRGLNKVMLIGRLGADPEIRYTQDGTPVASLSLATSRSVKKGDQWEDETDWHKVIAWRKLAEICERYLNKGSQIYVEGQIRTRSWEDKDGNKRYVTEVHAQDIQMLDSRKERQGGGSEGAQAPSPPVEDDVPF